MFTVFGFERLVDDRMLVKDIMIKKVATIDSNDTVFNACIKYRDKKIGCLVVLDRGFCVGIVTERDFIERTMCMHRNSEKTKIKEIMSSDIKTIHPLEKLENAVEMMKKYKIKKLPVISNNNLVGIVTISDIAQARPEITRRFVESWIKPRWED